MQRISVFEMLKVGVGPSSSHTTGPWRAAQRFLSESVAKRLRDVQRVEVTLFGSLAKTGRGHGTDVAVQLGLSGAAPESIDVGTIDGRIAQMAERQRISLLGRHEIPFDPRTDIVFRHDQQLPIHPNALKFRADLSDGTACEEVYYSIGGGFILTDGEEQQVCSTQLPYPIDTAAQLLGYCQANGCRISDIVLQNELSWRGKAEVLQQLEVLRDTMLESVWRGCHTTGVLPGGLLVQRRAAQVAGRLLAAPKAPDVATWIATIKDQRHDFQRVLDWVSCFALAVNEENASFGRIVTAPTNGAAGVVPAVMLYCMCFCDVPADVHVPFLLIAGEIACIFKKGATISGAMGGCQAEIGVASAMAAAALAECLGGSPAQAIDAAEIAMEHHLGMTCDPIGGLVQIPCIERNAMGAVKAIAAAQMALQRAPGESRVSLDVVIRTMRETARDMHEKYKETSEGGLAVQISENLSEC